MNSRLVLALALVLRIHQMHAGLIVNGSFEEATNGATLGYDSLSPGSTNIPGWTTTNAELTWDGPALGVSPPLSAAQGNDFLDLTGLHDTPPYGAVFQTITTVVGLQYQVSFEVGSDKYYDSYYTSGTFVAPSVAVSLNGSVAFTAVNDFPTATNYWQTWVFSFTASATKTILMFTGTTASRVAYIGLDNVVVTGGPLVIVLSSPSLALGQARIPFTLPNSNGTAYTYELLQSAKVNGPWATNHSAVLMTNVPNFSYAFTVPAIGADEFYRVQSP
jgi:hypothetical protein